MPKEIETFGVNFFSDMKKWLKDNKVILSVSTPTGLKEAKKIYGENL